jgi:hypothetical protein
MLTTHERTNGIDRGSGNVFADLGIPNPDLALARAELARRDREAEAGRRARGRGGNGVKQGVGLTCGVNPIGEPTSALPGTEAKIRVLMARAAAGRHLFHPGDAIGKPRDDEGEEDEDTEEEGEGQ